MLNATNRRCIPMLFCFDDDDRCLHVVCHNDLRLEGAHIPHVLTMKVGAGQTHDGTPVGEIQRSRRCSRTV